MVPEFTRRLDGLVLVMTGCAGLTVKATLDEAPPAVTTEMLTVPGAVNRLAGTAAVTWVELT